jgi:3-phenylpropionate/cinnamic acid dioxygenase small subunit
MGEPSLREIADRLEIAEVLDRYAEVIDGKEWDRLGEVFSADAVLDYQASGGPRGSVAEVLEWLSYVLSPFSSQHLMTNKAIRLDGDTATSRTTYFNPMRHTGDQVFFVGGNYEDRLVRTPDGWRIQERVQSTAWMYPPPS